MVFVDQPNNPVDFVRCKTVTARQTHGIRVLNGSVLADRASATCWISRAPLQLLLSKAPFLGPRFEHWPCFRILNLIFILLFPLPPPAAILEPSSCLEVPMSDVIDPTTTSWTATDLVARFGPIPLSRVRHDPAPGNATEQDVVWLHDREDRLYELVDGTLVEKTMGTYESYLAMSIGAILRVFVVERDLGIVLGADGMLRLSPGLVRIPDVSFVSWDRLPHRRIPREAIADLVPDLAVEVISPGNTHEEMDRKLREYFSVGVRLVWYVYPKTCEVHAYTSPGRPQVYSRSQTLDAVSVLPGFSVPLASIFANS
jgi:Uma2 family endonuclease